MRFLEVVVAHAIKEFEQRRPKLTSRERRKTNSGRLPHLLGVPHLPENSPLHKQRLNGIVWGFFCNKQTSWNLLPYIFDIS